MEDKEEPKEMFDKEDMTDMFSRAMFEKMQPQGEQNSVQNEFMWFIPLQRYQGPSTDAASAQSW